MPNQHSSHQARAPRARALFIFALALLAAAFVSACNRGGAQQGGGDAPQVAEGAAAPDFTLPADDGRPVKLSDYRGKQPVVLYFYPKDETPGCTKQACSFRDNIAEFKKAGVEVLGVSVDDVESHRKFKEKERLNFTLLADADKAVSRRYGVLGTFGVASRTTFVVDKDGVIRKIYRNVDPVLNATETLEFARTLA